MRFVLSTLVALSAARGASAGASDALTEDIRALRTDAPDAAAARIARIVRREPSAQAIAEAIRAAPRTTLDPDLARGWSGRSAPSSRSGAHGASAADRGSPYLLYVPRSLPAGDEPRPLLVHLHGGVGRATYPTRPEDAGVGGRLWGEISERLRMPIVLPLGRRGAEWWSDRGVDAVHDILRDCRRILPVDDDRIVGTGFSDGATGCFHLAMHRPEAFAAFIPMNGQPEVAAGLAPIELHPRNMARTPMLAIGTRNDALYPMASIIPHLLPALDEGAPLRIISWESGGHLPTYFPDLAPMIEQYIDAARRPGPSRMRWRFARPGVHGPVEIERLGGRNAETDQVMTTPRHGTIRVSLDPADPQRIGTVLVGGLGHALGMRPGDRVLSLAGRATPDAASLVVAALRVQPGDEPTARVERDGRTVNLAGHWPQQRPKKIYRRSGRVGLVEARIAGRDMEIFTEGVTRLRIEWPGPAAPPEAVRMNGSMRTVRWTPLDARELLERWAATGDAGQLRTHRSDLISVRR